MRLKTIYVHFHTSVMEDYVPLTYSTRVWAGRCLTTQFYGHLKPNQICNSDSQVTFRPLALGMNSSPADSASGPVALPGETIGGGTVLN
jgi:hypothetical protein